MKSIITALREPAKDGANEYVAFKSRDMHWVVDGEKADIKKILIDVDSIKTGFGKIQTGVAPEFVWADIPGTTIPRPSEDHAIAFQVKVYVSEKQGSPISGWRDWNSTQAGVREVFSRMWEDALEEAKSNPGKAAVVDLNGIIDIQMSKQLPKWV